MMETWHSHVTQISATKFVTEGTVSWPALRELVNVISSALEEIVNTNAMPKFVNIRA